MFQKSAWRAKHAANLANLITKSLSLKFSKINLLNQPQEQDAPDSHVNRSPTERQCVTISFPSERPF
jgi:hypothetical protein